MIHSTLNGQQALEFKNRESVPDVSIAIVNMDDLTLLRPCLQSILAHTRGITFEVLVVEFPANPVTIAELAREFPTVELIPHKERRGFSANMNDAVRRSCGRHVVILNDDTILTSNIFADMVAFLDSHPDYGAVGPRFLNPDGTFQLGPRGELDACSFACWEFKLDRLFSFRRLFGSWFMTYWDPLQPCEMKIANGACMMVRRETLEQVGLLEEHIFFGAEDLEWSVRMRRYGWKLHYLAQAPLIHLGGGTNRRDYNPIRLRIYKGLGWFFLTQRGTFQFWLFRLAIIIGALGRIGYWLVRLGFSPSKQTQARNEIRGRWMVLKLALQRHLAQQLLQST